LGNAPWVVPLQREESRGSPLEKRQERRRRICSSLV